MIWPGGSLTGAVEVTSAESCDAGQIGAQLAQGKHLAKAVKEPLELDEERARRVIPVLKAIFGVAP